MTLLNLNLPQILFIVVAPLILGVIIFLVIYIPLKRRYKKVHYIKYNYKIIHKIALYEDLYLINEFSFEVEDKKNLVIHHILFGNKFIYVITDYYYDGCLSGKENDTSLVFTSNNGERYYTDNCLTISKYIISRLCMHTGIGEDLMIGIALTNDKCENYVTSDSKSHYIVNRKDLTKFIKEFESKEVSNLNQEQLKMAVESISKQKERTINKKSDS